MYLYLYRTPYCTCTIPVSYTVQVYRVLCRLVVCVCIVQPVKVHSQCSSKTDVMMQLAELGMHYHCTAVCSVQPYRVLLQGNACAGVGFVDGDNLTGTLYVL